MPATRILCGECFESFAPSSLRRKPVTGKRVCRPCLAKIKAATPVETGPAPLMWYVLYVEIDADHRVVRDLKRQAFIESRVNDIPNVIAPVHKVTTYKNGQVKVTSELSFPGYVIVECRWSESMHHFVSSVRGVLGVLPLKPQMFGKRYARKEPPALRKPKEWEKEKAADWKPTALADREAAMLLISQAVAKKTKDAPLDFAVGDTVTITDGNFKTMSGPVRAIRGEGKDKRATVCVTMWGRELEVEVEPWQARKQ